MQNDISHTNLVLNRICPEKNERRFYALAITGNLFGETLLWRNWGRIGTGGRQRWDVCPDFAAASNSLAKLAGRKRQRGYWGI
jgi:predicted DNA-binding WGR domain protein